MKSFTLLVGSRRGAEENDTAIVFSSTHNKDSHGLPLKIKNEMDGTMVNNTLMSNCEYLLRNQFVTSYDKNMDCYKIYLADISYDDNLVISDTNRTLVQKIANINPLKKDIHTELRYIDILRKHKIRDVVVLNDFDTSHGKRDVLLFYIDPSLLLGINIGDVFPRDYPLMKNLIDFLTTIQAGQFIM